MAKQGTVSVARGLSRSFLRTSVLSAALLSAVLLSSPSFAGETMAPPTPSSTGSLPTASNPANNSTMGQMMAMQQAAMGQNANVSGDPFQGNVPKSTSLSANFGWMDTFDNNALNGGYGGGVTATHWITSHLGLTASIEIESFGVIGAAGNNTLSAGSKAGLNVNGGLADNSGAPIIPITLGGVYDFTGGAAWVNPQAFFDFGPAVSLYGQSMPLYVDFGVGVVTPLAKISDTLTGVDLFANIRGAYLSNIGGALDSNANGAAMWYMPVELGATFVF